MQNLNKFSITLDSQVNILLDTCKKVLDGGVFKGRIVKHKLQKHVRSKDPLEKLYAILMIISDGRYSNGIPSGETVYEALDQVNVYMAEEVARKYVQNQVEVEVENFLMTKQDKYMDDIRLSIIKKKKGPENTGTLRKYENLEKLSSRELTENLMVHLRPHKFSEIIGQERAIKSLISKIASPYPQHIILYGPPGVGKTSAARLALEEAKQLEYTPYDDDSKFVEVDGTTLRWDPREITNPLLGSVHDPIYQGSKRDLAETGIPEPKPGLVTEAHGGILFIDEIGELDSTLQNKLLKVLEDKKVEFSSAYYDPDDETVPKYIKYLFDNGAPADFVLIGATTREPKDINPALRSRCTEVYFEPLTSMDIVKIIEESSKKLDVRLEDGVAEEISKYTIEGRKAINILSDVYSSVVYKNKGIRDGLVITLKDIEEVISINRLTPYDHIEELNQGEVGKVYGLGVSGYMGSTIEIEAVTFKSNEKGKGKIRFNETAGSMAKDSVFNATSVIRKVCGVDLSDYDVHVNIVGGGNIDGPSAGAAITLAIISSITNKEIRGDVAITGEISLRGKVKPVGGVFEKIYGARRRGIKKVLIPKENIKDVPYELSGIEVISVDTIEDVIKEALRH
ncbi:ATP-dependent protease [Clostridium bornimense]|uniref:endopeptidase La n=1 Tax=Clostridium bornimense TaxID=1216932 RepID=W6RZ84_9CLOT|nr:Lon family ATP-dependent protease [Clostridium bornimense]CDM69793.1 ATP-dependent protease [Clostridium bornimense]